MFVVCTANRRVTYVKVGKPGVPGDATILEQSSLLRIIEEGVWLGSNISKMGIFHIDIQPYLLGDCAFKLTQSMMRSCTKPEKVADEKLEVFDSVTSFTRRSIECTFGMKKFRFLVLKYGFTLTHEYDTSYVATASVILRNLSISRGDVAEDEMDWYDDHVLHHLYDTVPPHVHADMRQETRYRLS